MTWWNFIFFANLHVGKCIYCKLTHSLTYTNTNIYIHIEHVSQCSFVVNDIQRCLLKSTDEKLQHLSSVVGRDTYYGSVHPFSVAIFFFSSSEKWTHPLCMRKYWWKFNCKKTANLTLSNSIIIFFFEQ